MEMKNAYVSISASIVSNDVFLYYLIRYFLMFKLSVPHAVVGESTIDIQCWFIHGSDALGCKVVLVSDCPNISNVHACKPFKECHIDQPLNNSQH